MFSDDTQPENRPNVIRQQVDPSAELGSQPAAGRK